MFQKATHNIGTIVLVVCIAFAMGAFVVHAQEGESASGNSGRINELKSEIGARASRIQALEREIEEQKKQLQAVGNEKRTLQRDIQMLDLSRDRLATDISVTENKISATNLQIEKLSLEIEDKEDRILDSRMALANSLRNLQALASESFVERLLGYEALSDFLNKERALGEFQSGVQSRLAGLRTLRNDLTTKREEETARQAELSGYKANLFNQKRVVEVNQNEKEVLLTVTSEEESNYEALLADRLAQKRTLEQELADFEAQLKVEIDPNSLPQAGVPIFAWPLKDVYITQYFGGTQFAKDNSSIYSGRAYHPGVDFGAPRGTPVLAPLSGTVRDTGNTDAVAGCYSWGKWVLLEHANGLTTFYTHLSVISVSPGQSVRTGDIISYTGNSGITTGPHLHFSVYATKGLTVRDFGEIKKSTNCAGAKTPTAPFNAQLDPMLYLPKE